MIGGFELGAHFLQAFSKHFNLLFQARNGRLLLLIFAVLFKELIQQHRVHRFVADGVSLTLPYRASLNQD